MRTYVGMCTNKCMFAYMYPGKELKSWEARLSVGFEDLDRTSLFHDQRSITEFIKHFKQFDFLAPPLVARYLFMIYACQCLCDLALQFDFLARSFVEGMYFRQKIKRQIDIDRENERQTHDATRRGSL